MTVEQALSQAIQYEDRIRDQYIKAAAEAREEEARALYEALAGDEASHAAYLRHQLAAWNAKRELGGLGPENRLPPTNRLLAAIARAGKAFSAIPEGGRIAALENALRAERETSAFYRDHADQLPEPAAALFRRMLEIEDGHTAIVQAELDLLSRSGHWFDIREFTLED